jgi:hypothetical protein
MGTYYQYGVLRFSVVCAYYIYYDVLSFLFYYYGAQQCSSAAPRAVSTERNTYVYNAYGTWNSLSYEYYIVPYLVLSLVE